MDQFDRSELRFACAFSTAPILPLRYDKYGVRSFPHPRVVSKKRRPCERIVMKQEQKPPIKRSPILRVLQFLRRKRKPEVTPPKVSKPEPTDYDWAVLVEEFEIRSRTNQRATEPPPPGVKLEGEIRHDLPMLPWVESAAMSALTMAMWNLGRLLRLDSVFLTFYPLPMFYVTQRWGVKQGDKVLIVSVILVFLFMGPLYSVLYFFNTGIMALVMSRAFWHRWHWAALVSAGGIAKGVGLAFQFTLLSGVIRENAWSFIGFQVEDLAGKILTLIWTITRRTGVPPVPTVGQIQVAVAIVLVIHSMLHVLCTALSAAMILDRVADNGVQLKRRVRLPGPLAYVKKKALEARKKRIY